MRHLCFALLLATPLVAQRPALGVFTASADVGAPRLAGTAAFDAATGRYTITGSGSDIWGPADQFHYVWREMSGDFTASATAAFETGGQPHRKASIMLRKTLDAASPFLHLAIHGDGLPSLQFRTTAGGDVSTLDFPMGAPGAWTLKLTRQGSTVTIAFGRAGEPVRELGHTTNQLGSPVLVGLAVASHDANALNTVTFRDVAVEPLAPAAPAR